MKDKFSEYRVVGRQDEDIADSDLLPVLIFLELFHHVVESRRFRCWIRPTAAAS